MRNKHACLYTSSYDRGLEHLLKIWPEVKKEVPKAELHVFYGWQLFDQFYKDNPGSMAWKDKQVQGMKQEGITDHGRVSQPEIKKWYKKCGFWTYPTHFNEISCISAMKAQAWGAVPVYMNVYALQDTVKYGHGVEGDIYDPETQEEYKNKLIHALKNPDEINRKEMMEWAQKQFPWDSVASDWSKEFKS